MTSHNAHDFIDLFLADAQLQQQLAASIMTEGALTFSQWQQLANVQGFRFSEAEFEAALNDNPTLIPALEAVAAAWGIVLQPELEFELTEDEMLTVAGGTHTADRVTDTGAAPFPSLKIV